jgi:RecA-family ATPase
MPICTAAEMFKSTPIKHAAWIEPGVLVKGGMMLLGGYTKVGKSFMALEIADCLAQGKPLFGLPDFAIPSSARVLYAELELGQYGLQSRIQAKYTAENPASDFLHVIYDEPDLCPDDVLGAENLAKLIEEHSINVLILDPASAFVKGNELDNAHIEEYFRGCRKLTARFTHLGLSIIFIHHFKKPSEEDRKSGLDEYRVKGAAKWVERPDTIVMCRRVEGVVEEGERWLLETKWRCRHMEDQENVELAVMDDWTVRLSGRESKVKHVMENAR